MKKKLPNVWKCCEGTGYFAENYKIKEEAFEAILGEIMLEEEDIERTADNLEKVFLRKCLDCESYWTGDDVCGECGQMRLSKRGHWAWYLAC